MATKQRATRIARRAPAPPPSYEPPALAFIRAQQAMDAEARMELKQALSEGPPIEDIPATESELWKLMAQVEVASRGSMLDTYRLVGLHLELTHWLLEYLNRGSPMTPDGTKALRVRDSIARLFRTWGNRLPSNPFTIERRSVPEVAK